MRVEVLKSFYFVLFLCVYVKNPLYSYDYFGNDFLTRGICPALLKSINADISFCIADLKFDGVNLKICEFGEGCHSKFRGFDTLYGTGKAWELFWIYLSRFNLPIWYVSSLNSEKFKEEIAYEAFIKVRGNLVSSFTCLERDQNFRRAVCGKKFDDPSSILNYGAIVCVRRFDRRVKDFKTKYPNVLVWDIGTVYYVNNKYRTAKLFNDEGLSIYRPRFWVLKRTSNSDCFDSYISDIVKNVIDNSDSSHFVIKPVASCMGHGILMVDRNDLMQVLRTVLKIGWSRIRINKNSRFNNRELEFWRTGGNLCLVEEFAESKPIVVDYLPYDPTMRVIFVLCYNEGQFSSEILGAYWKLPSLALNEKGRFSEKHKSHVTKKHRSAWFVEQEDFLKVKSVMSEFMPKIYEKMIYEYKFIEFDNFDFLEADYTFF